MERLKVNHASYNRLKRMADTMGMPLSDLAEQALNEWMETYGEPILNGLKRLRAQRAAERAGRLLEFPAGRKNG